MAPLTGALTAIEQTASGFAADVHTPACDTLWSMRSDPAQSPSQPAQQLIKSELTSSPDSRLLSLPLTVWAETDSPIFPSPEVVIQPSHKPTLSYKSSSQDVPLSVNASPLYLTSSSTRTNAFSHFLGPPVQGASLLSSNHVLTHRRQRQRTSNLIFASNETVTARDIPKILPPAPSTAPRRPAEPESNPFADFLSLKANYLDMLKETTGDTTMTDATVSPTDLHAPLMDDNYRDLVHAITQGMQHQQPPPTPELYSSPDFNDQGDEFLTTSPETDVLNTPVIAEDDLLTGMFEDDGGALLFPSFDTTIFNQIAAKAQNPPQPPHPAVDLHNLYTLTPESPVLQDFNPSVDPSIFLSPRDVQDSSIPSSVTTASVPSYAVRGIRKSSATGTRKGVTPAALVPVDAPTQPRNYITPSSTSRKDLPSSFARKRSRSVTFGEDDDKDEDSVQPPGPNPTERELIEYKRRQNTVAARRSRKRKLEYQQSLEERVKALEGECVRWKERVAICQEMMRGHGMMPPAFAEDC